MAMQRSASARSARGASAGNSRRRFRMATWWITCAPETPLSGGFTVGLEHKVWDLQAPLQDGYLVDHLRARTTV